LGGKKKQLDKPERKEKIRGKTSAGYAEKGNSFKKTGGGVGGRKEEHREQICEGSEK